MTDPATAAASSFFGVKLASLVAGFAGGVVSLSYLRELSKWQMLLAVATGSLTAGLRNNYERRLENTMNIIYPIPVPGTIAI